LNKNISVVSFFKPNVPRTVVKHQKQVVKKFWPNIEMQQVKYFGPHHKPIDNYMSTCTTEFVVIIDIDAIPLCTESLDVLIDMTDNGKTISGNPQRSNHLDNGEHIFVAPSFLCMSSKLYREIGSPSAEETFRSDVAEEWTYSLEETTGRKINVFDLMPGWDPVPDERWFLKGNNEYGLNTTFAKDGVPMTFHAFWGRKVEQQNKFIEKCAEIL